MPEIHDLDPSTAKKIVWEMAQKWSQYTHDSFEYWTNRLRGTENHYRGVLETFRRELIEVRSERDFYRWSRDELMDRVSDLEDQVHDLEEQGSHWEGEFNRCKEELAKLEMEKRAVDSQLYTEQKLGLSWKKSYRSLVPDKEILQELEKKYKNVRACFSVAERAAELQRLNFLSNKREVALNKSYDELKQTVAELKAESQSSGTKDSLSQVEAKRLREGISTLKGDLKELDNRYRECLDSNNARCVAAGIGRPSVIQAGDLYGFLRKTYLRWHYGQKDKIPFYLETFEAYDYLTNWIRSVENKLGIEGKDSILVDRNVPPRPPFLRPAPEAPSSSQGRGKKKGNRWGL